MAVGGGGIGSVLNGYWKSHIYYCTNSKWPKNAPPPSQTRSYGLEEGVSYKCKPQSFGMKPIMSKPKSAA